MNEQRRFIVISGLPAPGTLVEITIPLALQAIVLTTYLLYSNT